jgi:HEAT repeat protein
MGPVAIALIVAFVIGAAVGVYALLAPRRKAEHETVEAQRQELRVDTAWNATTAAEFGSLPEAARCDMIFAVSALDDERSSQLLEHALDDPSETVALAAARALKERGRSDAVDAYLARNPGDRAERIAHTLSLLAPP